MDDGKLSELKVSVGGGIEDDAAAFLHAMGRSIGPPWQAKHTLAAAAALAVGARRRAEQVSSLPPTGGSL